VLVGGTIPRVARRFGYPPPVLIKWIMKSIRALPDDERFLK
jgi:hypothetical protein